MKVKVKKLQQSLTTGLLSRYMPFGQREALKHNLTTEESQYFVDLLTNLEVHIQSMPVTYQQDGLGENAVVWLHYFYGATDAWITERDKGTGNGDERQHQAFGRVCLNGDTDNAETGYISIQEMINNSIELDLHWTNKTLKELG